MRQQPRARAQQPIQRVDTRRRRLGQRGQRGRERRRRRRRLRDARTDVSSGVFRDAHVPPGAFARTGRRRRRRDRTARRTARCLGDRVRSFSGGERGLDRVSCGVLARVG